MKLNRICYVLLFAGVLFGVDVSTVRGSITPGMPSLWQNKENVFETLCNGSFADARDRLGKMEPEMALWYCKQLATYWFQKRDIPLGKKYLNYALILTRENGYEAEEGNLLMIIAKQDLADYKHEDALLSVRLALQIYEKIDSKSGIYAALSQEADIYNQIGNNAEAIKDYKRLQQMADEAGYDLGVASCIYHITLLEYQLGLSSNTYESAQEALKIFEKHGDAQGCGDSHKLIGNYYMVKGPVKKALEHFNQAEKFYEKSGDIIGIGNCAYNSGIVLRDSKQFVPAIQSFRKAITMFTKAGATQGVGIAFREMGRVYFYNGKFTEAALLYTLAHDAIRTSNSKAHMGSLYMYLGDLEAMRNKDEARKCYKEAADLFDETNQAKEATRARVLWRKML